MAFAKLYFDTKWSDLKLICEGREFPTHRVVVCTRSPWFEHQCAAVPEIRGKHTVTVFFTDALTLHRVHKFLYTGEYDEEDDAIKLPPVCSSSPLRIEDGPASRPSTLTASPTASTFENKSDLLIDLDKTELFDQTLTKVCTDLEKFGLAPPAPFASPQIAKSFCHFRVFSASEELEIEDLSDYSLSKLSKEIEGTWSREGFTEFVRATFDLTGQYGNVSKPCHLIASECALHIVPLMDKESFHRLVETKPRLAYLIIKALVEQIKRGRKGVLEDTKAIVKPDILAESGDLAVTEAQVKVLIQKNSLVRKMMENDVEARVSQEEKRLREEHDKAILDKPETSLQELQSVIQSSLDDLAKHRSEVERLTKRNNELEAESKGRPTQDQLAIKERQLADLQQRFEQIQNSENAAVPVRAPSPVKRKGRGSFTFSDEEIESAVDDGPKFPSQARQVDPAANAQEVEKLKKQVSLLFKDRDRAVGELTSLKYELQDQDDLIKQLRARVSAQSSGKTVTDQDMKNMDTVRAREELETARAHIDALGKQISANSAGKNTTNTQLMVRLNEEKQLVADLTEKLRKANGTDLGAQITVKEKAIEELKKQMAEKTTNLTRARESNRCAITIAQWEAKLQQVKDLTSTLEQMKKDASVPKFGSGFFNTPNAASAAHSDAHLKRIADLESQLEAKNRTINEIKQSAMDKINALKASLREKQSSNGLETKPAATTDEWAAQVKYTADLESKLEAKTRHAAEMKAGATEKIAAINTSLHEKESAAAASQMAVQRLQTKLDKAEALLQAQNTHANGSNVSQAPVKAVNGGPMTFVERQQEAARLKALNNNQSVRPTSSNVAGGSPLQPRVNGHVQTPTGPAASKRPRQADSDVGGRGVGATEEKNRVLERQVKFYKDQLSQLRFATPTVQPRVPVRPRFGMQSSPGPARIGGPPGGGSSGDLGLRKAYNDALKIAGLDFKACNDCGIFFNSQFRGAPEDGGNTLILKCTKCNAECCRWKL